MTRLIIATAVTTLAAVSAPAPAADWNHWRGPTMNGVAPATESAVTTWSDEENALWRQPLPGPAGSTPVVAGERIFLTTPDGAELLLLAFDRATGEPLWRRTVTRGEAGFRGDEGNLASPSPTTDGRHVVAVMGEGTIACYTVEGEPAWRANLSDRLTPLDIQFGYASSPVLHDGKVLVQWQHGDGDPATEEARVVAFDVATGDTVWEIQRETDAMKECEHSYASPILVDEGDHTALVTHGADTTIAYDPATGDELWRVGGVNPPGNYHATLRFVASPAAAEGLLVAPTAKKGPVTAVRLGGSGDLTGGDRVPWRLSRGTPDVPSPLIDSGLVYLLGEDGALTCLDAESGEEVYERRTVNDRHRASPLLVDGRLYLASRKGVVTVVRSGREFEVLAKNDLGEAISASPIVVDGVLYLRTFDALWALGPAAAE